LYTSKKGNKYYYRYRNPLTGKEHGMGSDRQAAILAANELNGRLMPSAPDLVTRVIGGDHLMTTWLDNYLALYKVRRVKDRPVSAESIRSRETHIRHIRKRFGDKDLSAITTMDVSDYLDTLADTPTMAVQIRSALNDIFRVAITKGRCSKNPVSVTRVAGVQVMRSRLSLDEFNTVLAAAPQLSPFMVNAMLLAITTGQRLLDISNMKFSDVSDGWLHVKQHKTGAMVRLSLELGIDVLEMTIGDAVARCRDTVLSPHMLHHVKNHPRAQKGGHVGKDTISKGFAAARRLTSLQWDYPPTFHEIRSLSGRLYADQGINPQALLGHRDAATTALYVDVRGSEWVEVGNVSGK
jgi:integrase